MKRCAAQEEQRRNIWRERGVQGPFGQNLGLRLPMNKAADGGIFDVLGS
jgi:hypothetical protein